MRCLSIRQPWASRIARGEKTIELRSWSTKYRGPIIVVSGCRPWGKLAPEGPLGAVICVVDLIDVRPATAADEVAANGTPPDGWFAWVLGPVRQLPVTPAKGKLGLYRPDSATLALTESAESAECAPPQPGS